MKNLRVSKAVLLVVLTATLAACVCRPVRIDKDEYSTPSTVAELKSTLPQ